MQIENNREIYTGVKKGEDDVEIKLSDGREKEKWNTHSEYDF